MIADIMTIVQKEWKEIFYMQQSSRRGGVFGILLFVGVLGIMLPLQFGEEWVRSPSSLMFWTWIPLFLVSGVVADSFAGERERHTLETLLASRLPDRAILFGKLAGALSYGWGISMICLVISLVTTNVRFARNGELLFYEPKIFLAILVLSLLFSLFASGMGVLVSLRAHSARQAQQLFSAGMMLLFVPVFIFPILPGQWKGYVILWLANVNVDRIVNAVSIFLLVIDGLLIGAAISRFHRSRLVLD